MKPNEVKTARAAQVEERKLPPIATVVYRSTDMRIDFLRPWSLGDGSVSLTQEELAKVVFMLSKVLSDMRSGE